ncbi:hypothetical protein K402DRAFT_392156 [Aulographum hederae CBS 113979]|uniref:Galactose oxidase n=1 Tax=Aulographum hederae CBS 113979 TaxID=1176131 RepID=A0A6G1H3R1_9PEZI|nr:hypothetical protein K402DRAFT_392156 [Aulographum hederae CBS 113979]
MGIFSLRELPVGLLASLILPCAAQLPYNPTRIYTPQSNPNRAYILQPASSAQYQLASLDLTQRLGQTNIPTDILYTSLPFLANGDLTSSQPVIDSDGNLTIYTGNCSLGSGSAQIWRFDTEQDSKIGNGTWSQQSIGQDTAAITLDGPNFLGSSISFSSVVHGGSSQTNLYMFGGMCPSANSTADNWQSDAQYSNAMLTLDPTSSAEYDLGITTSRGPPIAEAGTSLTGLAPSFSNSSGGAETQQQSFVLIGGHTSSAFINMSQIAIFSLPQETWAFISVLQPSSSRTDLVVRDDPSEVEPRSGHTAVLTPDGESIILFGGWIGDVDTPAEPQLAVLNVGDGYGGQGDWSWSIPPMTDFGLEASSGLYGHGATMLPDGVMMVVGGYSIAPNADNRKRAAQTANTQALFYNSTSHSWLSEYSFVGLRSPVAPAKDTGALSTTAQKAGLGVGIAIAVAVIVALVLLFYFWYNRRLTRQLADHVREMRQMSLEANQINHEELIGGGIDGRGGSASAYDASQQHNFNQGTGWRSTSGHDAERTGLLVEIPSPTRGLRRNIPGRPTPHQVPRYDAARAGLGSGNIHPIGEEDEDQVSTTGEYHEKAASNRSSDPLIDPAPLSSHPVEGSTTGRPPSWATIPRSRDDDRPIDKIAWGRDWEKVHEVSPENNTHSAHGRYSPTKSDRTASTLSEQSARSYLSTGSATAVGSMTRTLSMRSAALLNTLGLPNPFQSPETSPTREGPSKSVPATAERKSGSLTSSINHPTQESRSSHEDSESFHSAQTNFSRLRAEGEVLLGGVAAAQRDRQPLGEDPLQDPVSPLAPNSATTTPTSPTFAVRPQIPRQRSNSRNATGAGISSALLGSVRRALGRNVTRPVSSGGNGMGNARSSSMTAAGSRYSGSSGMATSSARESAALNRGGKRHSSYGSIASGAFGSDMTPPRRAASDAGFWKARRGAKDWEPYRDDPDRRRSGDDWGEPKDQNAREDEDEGDWDVEAAAENRVVQVTYTVPRERLRVVNAAEADTRSLLSSVPDEEIVIRKREKE